MMRLVAVANNSCLTVRSSIVLLTILLASGSEIFLHKKRCQKVAAKRLFGRDQPAKKPKRHLCQPL